MKKNFAMLVRIGLLTVTVLSMLLATVACGNEKPEMFSTEEVVGDYEEENDSLITTDNATKTQEDTTAPIKKNKKPKDNKSTSSTSSTSTSTKKSNYNPYSDIASKKDGKSITIMLWWKPSKTEEKVMKDFKSKYNIDYKVVTTTHELYQTRLTAMVASNKDVPDICAMDHESFPIPIIKNQVQMLSSDIFDLKNDDAYDISQMDLFKWKGKYYGIQLKGNMTYQRGCVYFNETLFKERGITNPYDLWKKGQWNWDTFKNCAKKMTFSNGGKTTYGITSDNTWITYLMASTKTDFVKNTGKEIKNNLSDKNIKKTLSLVSDLKLGGYWNPQEGGTKALVNRETAMLLEGSWLVEANSASNSLEPINGKWGVVPIPSPKGQTSVQAITPTVWCIVSGAKSPKSASYFLRYWLDSDNFNMKNQIPNSTAREVFNAMNENPNRYGIISHGITTYVDSNNFWQLLAISEQPKNDIPVSIQEMNPMLNGILAQIKSDSK